MSGSSIFETSWINLVFEGRNKEYGAYQLRRENPKTTLKALFLGLCLITALAMLPYLLSSFGKAPVESPIITDTFDHVTPISIMPKQPEAPKANPATPPIDTQKPDQPVINDNPIVTDAPHETPNLGEGVNTNPTTAPGTSGTGTPVTGTPGGDGTEPGTVTTEIPIDKPYIAVDKMPEYPGGINKFRKYIADNFKAPDAEESGNNVVKVLVSFVVEIDGSISDIKIVRNPGYGMDKEAIRVLKSMKTKWNPGMIAGHPVRTIYNLPIAIQPKQ
ncbi:energy transducer TonB [Flavobacterium pallidum]|uniref:Energy transducer TonB n=1 Tax=Flavobacterium pallidum TaxID=2172098 RepID=A0A2S1SHH9_9FLAO|nr:energy transducer TonB [Flavobacterium pallidum]AWI25835.1 energy transducer TonB [Flavobacterium pallidum]